MKLKIEIRVCLHCEKPLPRDAPKRKKHCDEVCRYRAWAAVHRPPIQQAR